MARGFGNKGQARGNKGGGRPPASSPQRSSYGGSPHPSPYRGSSDRSSWGRSSGGAARPSYQPEPGKVPAVDQDKWYAKRALLPYYSSTNNTWFNRLAGAKNDLETGNPARIASSETHMNCEAYNRPGMWMSMLAGTIRIAAVQLLQRIGKDGMDPKCGLPKVAAFFESEAGQELLQACLTLDVNGNHAPRSAEDWDSAVTIFGTFMSEPDPAIVVALRQSALFSAQMYVMSMNMVEAVSVFGNMDHWANELAQQIDSMPPGLRRFAMRPDNQGALIEGLSAALQALATKSSAVTGESLDAMEGPEFRLDPIEQSDDEDMGVGLDDLEEPTRAGFGARPSARKSFGRRPPAPDTPEAAFRGRNSAPASPEASPWRTKFMNRTPTREPKGDEAASTADSGSATFRRFTKPAAAGVSANAPSALAKKRTADEVEGAMAAPSVPVKRHAAAEVEEVPAETWRKEDWPLAELVKFKDEAAQQITRENFVKLEADAQLQLLLAIPEPILEAMGLKNQVQDKKLLAANAVQNAAKITKIVHEVQQAWVSSAESFTVSKFDWGVEDQLDEDGLLRLLAQGTYLTNAVMMKTLIASHDNAVAEGKEDVRKEFHSKLVEAQLKVLMEQVMDAGTAAVFYQDAVTFVEKWSKTEPNVVAVREFLEPIDADLRMALGITAHSKYKSIKSKTWKADINRWLSTCFYCFTAHVEDDDAKVIGK